MRVFAILSAAALQAAFGQAAPDGVSVTARVNRTALYPGDRLEYVVRVEHPGSFEFVGDSLKKDQLSLDPFEILEVASTTGSLAGARKLFEVKFLLRTFATGDTALAIPSFNLFYFRRTPSQDQDNSPAETLAVPAFTIGLRSTVPGPNAPIRDSKTLLPVSLGEWLLPDVMGLGGLAAVAAWLTWLVLVRWRSESRKHGRTEEIHRKSLSESLEEIRQFRVDSTEDAETFYRKASELLRGFATGRPGEGAWLTPPEVEPAAVSALLDQCDRVRYAPGGLEKGLGQRSEFLRKLEELVERR